MNPNRSCTSGVHHVATAPAWPSGSCSFTRRGLRELQIPDSAGRPPLLPRGECKLTAPGRAAARGQVG
ncbi:hypothetical protein MC885_003883 [Smutsia gigantea]|nr:hypothetical protein MC885_003883 [Smutsia gigantea]